MKSLILILITFSFLVGAEPSQLAKIHGILQLPLPNRLQVLRQQPEHYFKQLKNVFYSKKINESIKWKALMSMARLYPKKSRYTIKQALRHSSWFMKNAGLIALEISNPKESLLYARKFLDHPSLVLRTASVDLIRRQKATQYVNILWKKLYAKENFRKNKGLWIRRNIVMALYELAEPTEKQKFIKLLKDSDPKVHALASMVLNQWGEERPIKVLTNKEKLLKAPPSQPILGKGDSPKKVRF